MKCYFDNIEETNPNMFDHSSSGRQKWWIVASGTIIKKYLKNIGETVNTVDNIDEPGCYFIDVNGDPNWWSGKAGAPNTPDKHILYHVSEKVLNLVKQKKLRLIIAADREGGTMRTTAYDCFLETTKAIDTLELPVGSVLIMQGNKKIEKQYQEWCESTNNDRLFDVMYSNHFARIFFDSELPKTPVSLESINNPEALDFNSLNRVYRVHRGAHLYFLATNDLIKQGLVSANDLQFHDTQVLKLISPDPLTTDTVSINDFKNVLTSHYPLYIDGNWSQENAANQYNVDIYKNSLMSFITETKFDEDVAFLTEKVFKPIALGHPLIVLASAGTLQGLEELGFKTNWCNIDPSYNSIKDDRDRFIKTNEILKEWIALPREEKISRITNTMHIIEHNFNLIREKDFYKFALQEAIARTQEYFKNA